MHIRFDLREEPEHFLVHAAALRIVVAHRRLRDAHRPCDVHLLHFVRVQQLPGQPRADCGKQPGDYEFLGLKHPARLVRLGPD